jgi:hypothetical protein
MLFILTCGKTKPNYGELGSSIKLNHIKVREIFF